MQKKLQVKISAKDTASKSLKGLRGEVKKTDRQLKESLKTAGLWGAGIAAGAGLAVKSWLEAAGGFEQTQIAFTTMLGSADAAQKKLAELSDFASRTPFTLKGVENNARLLMAMGIESDNVLPTLKSLGDVSAGLSVDLQRIALNYGQVATQTKLTGVELKDFLRAGVPLLTELSKNLGIAESKIKEMVSRGEIGFDAVEEAFRSMTNEGGKFANLMDKQSKSLKGQLSNIEDSFELLSREIGASLLPLAKQLATAIQNLAEWFRTLSPETKKMIATVTVAAGALGLLLAAVGLVAVAIPAVISGLAGLAAVFTALISPIGLVVAALGALAYAYIEVNRQRAAFEHNIQQSIEYNNQLAESYRQLGESLPSFADQASEMSAAYEAENKLNELLVKRLQLEDQLAGMQPWQQEKIEKTKQELKSTNELIKAKEKEVVETIRGAAQMADERAKAEGEIFRNATKLADLRNEVTKEEFDLAINYMKKRGGVNDEVNRSILRGDVELTKEKLKLMDVIAENELKVTNGILQLSADEANERLRIAKDRAMGESKMIQQLLNYNADASNKELKLFAEKLTKEQNLSAQMKNDLAAIFSKPIFQEVKVILTDEDTNIFDKIKNLSGYAKSKLQNAGAVFKTYQADLAAINDEFDVQVEKIRAEEQALEDLNTEMSGSGGGGGGGGSAPEELKEDLEGLRRELDDTAASFNDLNQRAGRELYDLAQKHEENIAQMDSKIDDLKNNLKELETAYNIQIQGFDKSMAERAIEQERLVKELTKRISEEEDEEKALELYENLQKEEKALQEFMDNAKGLEEELAEARRRASLTEFERFVEDMQTRKEKAQEEFDAKKERIQEEISLIKAQKDEEIAAFQEKVDKYNNLRLVFSKYKNELKVGMIQSAQITREKVDEMIAKLAALQAMMNGVGISSVASLTGGEPVSNNNTTTTNNININLGSVNVKNEQDKDALIDDLVRQIQLQQVNST